MDEALGEALDLYVETRNGLAQHENDVEALWKVVIAADNLAETVEAPTVKGGVTMRNVLVAALVGALAFLTFTTRCGSPSEPTATVTVTKTVWLQPAQ